MQTAWFIAIALLWALYLVLEGFDFGVGMLLRRVRDDHHDRRVALHAIGPTWAGNEVWLIVAVVGMFGAFPGWYAAWSSAFYLPLAVVLLALIARGMAIELMGKRDDERWRTGWERVLVVSSTIVPFCWGLIWTAALAGVEVRETAAVGGAFDVISAYSVLGGLALVALCRALGAAFLALRTDEAVHARALRELRVAGPVAALLAGGLVASTAPDGAVAAVGCTVALLALAFARAPGRAFAAGCAAIGLLVAVWFSALWPSGLGGETPLTLADVAAGDYTLTLMTVLTAVLLPLLLAVQAWSYWVFRERVTRAAVGAPLPSPVELIERLAERRGW